MSQLNKNYTATEKTKVALEAIKGQLTLNEITQQYGVHRSQILRWKKHILEKLPEAFIDTSKKQEQKQDELIDQLYQQIGQLTVERDFLKKKSERFA
jgi:transposase